MLNNAQFAAVHVLDRERCKIHIWEAANIYAPFVWGRPRATKRQDAAHRTEVVFGDLRVPLVYGQRLDGCEQAQVGFAHSVYQGAPPATYRTVAYPHVIKVGVDLELDFAAVTTAAVRLLHGV